MVKLQKTFSHNNVSTDKNCISGKTLKENSTYLFKGCKESYLKWVNVKWFIVEYLTESHFSIVVKNGTRDHHYNINIAIPLVNIHVSSENWHKTVFHASFSSLIFK